MNFSTLNIGMFRIGQGSILGPLGRMQYKPFETIAEFGKFSGKNALPPPRACTKNVLPPLHEVKIIVYTPPTT